MVRQRGALLFALMAAALASAASPDNRLQALRTIAPAAQIDHPTEQSTRIFAAPLTTGPSAVASADTFIATQSASLGVPATDLLPGNTFNGRYTQPVAFDPATGQYRFTLVYYHQARDGVPVYGSDIRLLVRNAPGYPLVLASASVRELGTFQVPAGVAASLALHEASLAALKMSPSLTDFGPTDLVIWAGTDTVPAPPQTAMTFIADNYGSRAHEPERWRFVADAATGAILHRESLIHRVDIAGTVSARVTQGPGADVCGDELVEPLPYARIDGPDGVFSYADADGAFLLPAVSDTPALLSSAVSGRYFTVDDRSGAVSTLTDFVTPPGPVAFLHNADNTDPLVRAQVNAYTYANRARDYILQHNPAYPTISTQTGFPINVNRADWFCPGNAWYDRTSINFCLAGDEVANSAFQTIVVHEYGHHLVEMGGSGQGTYGEGMSDTLAMLVADDPGLGYGFFFDCAQAPRSADNELQYPCDRGIHYCGQILSGSFWDLYQILLDQGHADAREIVSRLAFDSVLLHRGRDIDPGITIDVLTLDDDDAWIGNGTPHRDAICAAFARHNLDCPHLEVGLRVDPQENQVSAGYFSGPLLPYEFEYTLKNQGPGPLTYEVATDAPWLDITNATGTLPQPDDTATVRLTLNLAAYDLPQGTNTAIVDFIDHTNHVGDTTREIAVQMAFGEVYFWPLDTDPNWTTEGQWAFGQPTGEGGEYGHPDPNTGYTGPNVYGYNLAGDYENEIGEQHLTTTPIDCTGLTEVKLRFWRWLGVEQPAYDHAYIRVSNDNENWTTVWENDREITDDAWTFQEVDISSVADNEPNVYVRWTMGESDVGWMYCGWNIDDVSIYAAGADPPLLTLHIPDGPPTCLLPHQSTSFDVILAPHAEDTDPNEARLHYRYDDGNWQSRPLTPRGDTRYTATLPPAIVGDTPEFYLTAASASGVIVRQPDYPPDSVYTAVLGAPQMAFVDDFETDQGWSVFDAATDGGWVRTVPAGCGAGDPPTDADGSGHAFVTGAACGHDVDNGTTTLTSPLLSLPDGGTIRYAYWLNDTDAAPLDADDALIVEVSTATSPDYHVVRTYPTTSDTWATDEILVGLDVPASSTIRVRFVARDTGADSTVEAAIDAFAVATHTCDGARGACCAPDQTCEFITLAECHTLGWTFQGAGVPCWPAPCPPPLCRGDANCDGRVSWRDVDHFVAGMNDNEAGWRQMFVDPNNVPCSYTNLDANGDGYVNFRDIDAFLAVYNTNCVIPE